MFMTTSQMLKFVDLSNTQNHKIKEIIHYTFAAITREKIVFWQRLFLRIVVKLAKLKDLQPKSNVLVKVKSVILNNMLSRLTK